ncbi:MAG: T9SS type A sorting domain-containing protein [Flavobacteriales bacterium]
MRVYLSLLLLCLYFKLSAQWTHTNGPYNAPIEDLVTKDNLIFAAGETGVFVYTPNDNKWEYKSSGQATFSSIRSIAANDSLLFAGDFEFGIFVSADNGDTWHEANNGLNNLYVTCIFINGQDIFVGTWAGLYKSSNQGNSWSLCDTGIPLANIRELTKLNGSLYVATNLGIFKSDDNGTTWMAINTGLNDTNIFAITQMNNYLFAINASFVYLSTDQGLTWNPTYYFPASAQPTSLFAYNSTLFMGQVPGKLLKSVDNGVHWTQATTGMSTSDMNTGLPTVYCHTIMNNTLYVGSGLGLHQSNDNGDTWQGLGLGYAGNVNALLLNGNELYCGTSNGFYKSSDFGDTWRFNNDGLPSNVSVRSILVKGSELFIGTFYKGIFYSVNNGATWTPCNSSLTSLNINKLYLVGNTIFAATSGNSPTLQSGVYQSTDNGNTWQYTSSGLPSAIYVYDITSNGSKMFVGTSAGVYSSTDNGNTWSHATNGIPTTTTRSVLAVDEHIFAGQNYAGNPNSPYYGGVSTSDDGGENWWHHYYWQLITVPYLFKNGSAIYAATQNYSFKLYKSSDLGQNWDDFGAGLGYSTIRSMDGNANLLFAGTNNGVWINNHTGTTGVDPVSQDDLTIVLYPNPTSDLIHISTNQDFNYELFNLLGQKISTGKIANGVQSISLDSLAAGNYILQFTNDKNTVQKKFVKN